MYGGGNKIGLGKNQKWTDKLLDFYLSQPKILYSHLFGHYHQFIEEIIPYMLIQEQNNFYESVGEKTIYTHGFSCTNIKIKPPTFENDNEIKFPTDARKNHLNYFGTVVADIQQFVDRMDAITGIKDRKYTSQIEVETPIANIPIMIKSKYCATNIKQDLKGECKIDPGGYFIVNGSEKIVMSMEKMVDNKILVFTKKDTTFEDGLQYMAQINSRKNDWSDNLQILTIKNRKDGVLLVTTSSQLVDIPLFILLRALGVESDQMIISYINNDLTDVKVLNLLRSSISASTDDEGRLIRTKEQAIDYIINRMRRNKRISQTDENVAKAQKKMYLDKIFKQDLLPHLGDDIPKKMAFICWMAKKLCVVMLKRETADDRDAPTNKRIEPPGYLIAQLFRQNWKKALGEIGKHFKKKNQNDEEPINVIGQINPMTIEQSLKTAMATGVWGMNKTKRGVAQSLQRLSWVQGMSYLRRVLSPSMEESTSKVTSIRMVNGQQINFFCPSETPEGQKIGIVKSMAFSASVTMQNSSQKEIIHNILKSQKGISHPYDVDPLTHNYMVKILTNGDWYGICKFSNAQEIYNNLKIARIEGKIDCHTTIMFDYKNKEIKIYWDGGRLIRPVLIVNNNKLNYNEQVIKFIQEESKLSDISKSWKKFMNTFPNMAEYEDIESMVYNMVSDVENKLDESNTLSKKIVVYNEKTKINRYGDYRWVKYTHCDFHPWLILGSTVSNVPFSNHNYGTRNIIHFSQAKQSIGIFLTSYKDRMDISQILYHPHLPICMTRAMKYNGCQDLPYGENAIVGVLSYNGLMVSSSYY